MSREMKPSYYISLKQRYCISFSDDTKNLNIIANDFSKVLSFLSKEQYPIDKIIDVSVDTNVITIN